MIMNKVTTKEKPVLVSIADDGYSMALAVALSSAVFNLKSYEQLKLFIIDGNVSPKNKNKIMQSLDKNKVDVTWLKPKNEILKKLKGLTINKWLTHMTYYRLMIPYLLPEGIDKAIVLDSDLIVKGDLGELWDVELDNQYIVAAQNLDWKVSSIRGINNYKELGIDPNLKYFNSGVMVLNLNLWRKNSVSEKVIAYVQENEEHIRWCDQDGLNAILAGKWKEIDPLWNYEAIPNPYDEKKLKRCHILHYTGPRKPWHYQFDHPTRNIFYQYLELTAWSDWKPKRPFTLKSVLLDSTRPLRNAFGFRLCQLFKFKVMVHSWILKLRYKMTGNLSVKKRDYLPLVLNALNLKGEGVEIGVYQGFYSEAILKKSNLKLLYSVDPWKIFAKDEYVDIINTDEEELYKSYLITVKKLSQFRDRNRILRMASKEAVDSFEDCTLDFIYIDAQHSYEACQEDIKTWWPKLKTGGIFAGHDYINGSLPEGEFGVKRAVDEFVAGTNLKLYVTDEQWPTWYMVKE